MHLGMRSISLSASSQVFLLGLGGHEWSFCVEGVRGVVISLVIIEYIPARENTCGAGTPRRSPSHSRRLGETRLKHLLMVSF